MVTKFAKALNYKIQATGNDGLVAMRFLYEFWGYVINGTDNLTTPGAMDGYVGGQFEGVCVRTSGNDGATSPNSSYFTSLNGHFTPYMVGCYLTIWTSTHQSQDDSIYEIVGYVNPQKILININNGGHPDPATSKPTLYFRSGLNYRVVDIYQAQFSNPPYSGSYSPYYAGQYTPITVPSPSYFVGTMNASNTNPGQANSQFKVAIYSFGFVDGFTAYPTLGVMVNPAGTWNGTSFADGYSIPEIKQSYLFIVQQGSFPYSDTGYVTLVGDVDFFHMFSNNVDSSGACIMSVIVPKRLYTQIQDPNPIVMYHAGQESVHTNFNNFDFGSYYWMLDHDNVARNCRLIIRNASGDGKQGTGAENTLLGEGWNDNYVTFNQVKQKVPISTALFASSGTNASGVNNIAGQYSFGRCEARVIRTCPASVPNFQVLGDQGQYLHVYNGLVIPWDGTIPPYSILPF